MARHLLLSTALQTGVSFIAISAALPADAQPAANARPTGGTIVAGGATISQTGNDTKINQSTQRAAIDWRSFDVGSRQSVTFNQPSSTAIALNRVTGPDPSQIAGRIDANGQIILVNQSGVNFFKGAQVNTNGLMVSAIGMSNKSVTNFMASGGVAFDRPGNPNARIDNQGSITIRQAGLAALVAPQVANSGTITAKLGHVVLAGAKTATLDLYGDGLLSLNVTNQVTEAPVGKDGKAVTTLVTNTGVITADGGTVQLTARAADGIVQNLVQAGGQIRAASMGEQTGVVALNGVGGSIVVEGQLAAPGRAPGTTGGAIEVVSNANVVVAAGAKLDVSGRAGGGAVAIGTTLAQAKGGPGVTPARVAANVTVRKGASIKADAIGNGDGGRVTVLSSGTTTLAAPIRAKGGPQGGNGGFVETSGSSLVIGSGVIVDAGARTPTGKPGTWLLDPLDLDVVNGDSNVNVATSAGPPFTVTPSAVGAQISNITIENELNGLIEGSGPTNVVLTTQGTTGGATGTITVDTGAPITWASGTTLTMNASGSIIINAPISNTTNTNAALTLTAGGRVSQDVTNGAISIGNLSVTAVGPVGLAAANAVTTIAGSVTGAGNSFFLRNDSTSLSVGTVGGLSGVTTNGGPIALTTTKTGELTLAGNLTADSQTVTLVSAGGITQNSGGITATTLTGSTAGATFLITPNNIAALGPFNTAGQLFILDDSKAASLTVNSLTAGTIGLTAPVINIPGVINGNSVKLTASGGGINEAGGSITSPTLFGSATGTVDLTGTNNISTLSGFTASGQAFTLLDSAGLTLFGDVTAATVSLTAPSITVTTPLSGTTSVALNATGGRINESALLDGVQFVGSIITPLLTGSATGTVDLTGTNNIAALGRFDATGQSITLLDANAAKLAVNGLTAATVSLTAPVIDIPGAITATTGMTLTATDGGITIGTAGSAGTINAGTLLLTAKGGSITEPNGAIVANSFSANASQVEGTADVLLPSTGNKIAVSTGITAGGGDVVLVDDPTLVLTGLHSGNNLFFEVTLPGGSLQLGDAKTAATLNATSGGRISLVADGITVRNTSSTIAAPFGTLELAPFSQINESVAGTSAAGQLLIDPTLLSIISGGVSNQLGTLRIGGFTNVPASATIAAASAISVTIDGPVDLANKAFELNLLAKGPITEPGGPLTVTQVSGSSVGTFSLANPANAIAETAGITATNGDVIVVSQSDLELLGAHTGNNLFFEVVATGGALTIGNGDSSVSLNAATGGRISLIADQITDPFSVGTISAPAGTLELAPFSAINTSVNGTPVAGQLLIDGTLLSAVTPALNTLVIGGFTNAPAGATASTPSAGSVTIDGPFDLAPLATTLNFEAIGSVTQTAPILNVGTLIGTTGSTTLTNPGNTVATLGNYAATSGLAFTDATNLLIAGSVITGGTAAFTIAGALTETGSLTAAQLTGSTTGATTLTGSNQVASLGNFTASNFALNDSTDLLIAGAVTTGGTAAFTIAGALTETGSLTAAQLTGSTTGATTLTGSNQVASLGNFTASNFALNDNTDLLIAGAVTTGGTAAFTIAGALTETGSLTAAQLTGSTTGATDLTGSNQVASLGNFTASNFALNDNTDLLIAGAVTTGGTAAFTIAGALTETGSLTAAQLTGSTTGATDLTGSNQVASLGNFTASNFALNDSTDLLIAGAVTTGGTAAFTIAGALTETGSLTAAQLTGSTTGATTLTGNNQVASLGNFTASNFALNDSIDLLIAGAVATPGTAAFTVAGALTETGSLTAAQLTGSTTGVTTLTGSNQVASLGNFTASNFALNDSIDLLIAGAVTTGGTAAFTIAGALTETGSLTAAQLTGSTTGATDLTGSNQVASLGNFTASNFALNDSTDLLIAGAVTTGGTAAFTIAGALTETGSLTAAQLTGSTTGATTLTGSNQVASLGNFTASNFALNDSTDLLIAGAVTTGGTAAFTIAGALTETGSLTAAQLTGSTTGATTLTGSNQVASLGNFTASNFALNDNTDLLIAGAVTTGGTAAFTIAGALTETGSLTAAQLTGSTTGATDLTGSNQVASLGNFTASNFALNDSTDLLIAGAVTTGGTAAFTIAGALTETGSLTAAQLTGSTTGATTLTGNNQVASLGNFTASNFALNDSIDLLIAGAVATPGTAAFTIAGALTETGSLTAAQLTGSTTGATTLTGNNQVASLGNFTASNFALNDSIDLLIAGAVATPGTAAFTVAGALTETGSLTAAQLTGSTTGVTTLTGSNQVASLGNFTASNFALNDSIDLLIAGAVTTGGTAAFTIAGALTETGSLTAAQLTGSTTGATDLTGSNQVASLGNFTASNFALNDSTDLLIAGAVTTGGTAAFTIAGALTETGSLTAAQLTGSTTGATTLTGNNQVASLGNFTASNFALNDNTDLLIANTLNAPTITILAPASRISLGDGATIVTTDALLQSVDFAQIGTSTVLGQGGRPSTLRISTTGIQQFDPPLGLQATGTTLNLDLHGGTAAGAVFVKALDVSFTAPGGANLTGTIAGIVGGPAAAAGHIQPAVNIAYLFNGCVIGAPTCSSAATLNAGLTATLGAIEPLVTLPPPTLATLPGLVVVALPMLQARPPQLTDPDVVPPNITYLDY